MSELLLQRGLPAVPDMERYVLGAVLMNASENLPIALDLLTAQDFHLNAHATIFARVQDLFARGEKIDRVTVARDLIRVGQLEAVGGVGYLVSLDDGLPQMYNLDAYCEQIRTTSMLRIAIAEATAGIDALTAAGATLEAIREFQTRIAALNAESARTEGFRHIAEVIEQTPGGPTAFFNPPKEALGIEWPVYALTEMTGGFAPGQITVIKADTGIGKTTLATQCALNAVRHGFPTAILTLEMTAAEQAKKIICQHSQAPLLDWLKGSQTEPERKAVMRAARELYQAPLWFDDRNSVTPAMLDAALFRMKTKPALLVIDYLQLMDSGMRDGSANREQHVASISRAIKRLAKKYNVAAIVLSQVNEQGKSRESRAIEQDATFVVELHQCAGSGGVYEGRLTKGRFAARRKVELLFRGDVGLFCEVERQ